MKMISVGEIKSLILNLGFYAEDGKDNIFMKNYPAHNNYIIRIDFNTKKIEYRDDDIKESDGIKLGDTTTSNFKSSENFVVLECVDRLLEKGYSPDSITLEKKSKLGRKEKGKLDINVADSDGNSYIMIECKTWGNEFIKERNKMLKDGGQLFSYFNAVDRSAKYLCLYTSRLDNESVVYKSDIISIDESWHELSTTTEIYEHWNKNFKDNGIFEDSITAYNVEIKALIRGRLQPLTKDDSGKIFNQFAEILRHNVVSDKPNAFNKILNLFICKIIDEDKNDDEQVDFQWLDEDDNYSLQLRLNDLYKEGMNKFLGIDVTDFSEKDIDDVLINLSDSDAKARLLTIFKKLRLQKNPEFAFIEVYDENSFDLNARVVREVVELLQPYQFRYGHKQQFLGDFFEKLLNTSMKQEAGQFFTPTPVAHYIISCLPLKEFIIEKLKKGNSDGILPTVIDFACGTGHFLTEYMDMIQSIIDAIDISSARRSIKPKLEFWRSDGGQYQWANEYVYGVDADYRLVKSSKVSSFLNGDGEANIIRANGLDHFRKSKDYRGKLLSNSSEDSKDNAQFDVLIANPPYSVNAFKSTVRYGEESFELFEKLTDNSSEIECLFIERMKQLLKVGGYAGIILPSSILSNSGIYVAAREIILKYFYVVGITEFGSNTFMATNANTVTLFLKRRDNSDWKKIENAVFNFFDKPKDITVLGIEKAFSKYVETVFEDITLDDYISLVNRKPTQAFKILEIYEDYKNWFVNLTEVNNIQNSKEFKELTENEKQLRLETLFFDKIFDIEQDKLLYFLLTYSQKTVIVKTGEKQAEKDFLGYEFSNTRGHEGIKEYEKGSKLFDKDNLYNSQKANYYVYKAFLNEHDEIDEELRNNIYITFLSSLLDFKTINFNKTIKSDERVQTPILSKYRTDKLKNLVYYKGGNAFPKEYQNDTDSINTPFIKVSDMKTDGNEKYIFSANNYVSSSDTKLLKATVFPEKGIIFPKIGQAIHTNKKRILSRPSCVDNNIMCIYSKNEDIILNQYIYCIFNEYISLSNFASLANPPTIQNDILFDYKIPVPPIDIQKKIVDEIEIIEQSIIEMKHEVIKLQDNIYHMTETVENDAKTYKKLRRIACINPQKPNKNDYDQNMKISFIEMAAVSEDGFIQTMETKSFRSIQKGGYTSFINDDIIIAKITPCMENGKCALVSNLENGIGYGSTEFHVIRANKEEILPKYLFLLLNRDKIREEAKTKMTGKSGHRRVPSAFYDDLDIPIISIRKQKEFVNQIELLENNINKLKAEVSESELKKKIILENYLY